MRYKTLLALTFLMACAGNTEPKAEVVAPRDVTPNPATVFPAGTPRVVAPGILQPQGGEVEVSTDVPGLLKEILVKEGDMVATGQVLARYDSSIEEARVAAAQARVDAAQSSVKRAQRGNRPLEKAESASNASAASAKANLSRDAYERERALLDKGATTQDAVDRAQRQAEADEALANAASQRSDLVKQGARSEDRDLANADLNAAKAQLQEVKAALAKRELRAPKDGLILDVLFEAGEYYAPSAGALLLLGDMAHSEVLLEVDELDVPRVVLGQVVVITADGYTEPVTQGIITSIAPRMGKKTLTSDRAQDRIDTRILEVTVSLSPHNLRSGLRVWGTINVSQGPQAAAN
jgi:multidrug resistance efflux pump